jgi:hypothetical protein
LTGKLAQFRPGVANYRCGNIEALLRGTGGHER